MLREAATLPPSPPELARRYLRLNLRDVNLSYAGRLPPAHPAHRAIAGLSPGAPLEVTRQGNRWEILNGAGVVVGRLSGSFEPPPKMRCVSARVLAVACWTRERSEPQFQERLRCDSWEVVVPELVFEPEP